MQWSVHTFLLILLCSQDQILKHQVLSGVKQLLAALSTSAAVIAQLHSWSDASVAIIPPCPGVSHDGGMREDASAGTTKKPALSFASWEWVCVWLLAMHVGVWSGTLQLSLLNSTCGFKVCLGLFWKTWMQLSWISPQICSFGLACNELNFILPVLHSQIATQNLNSFNNSLNHPIRLIIKA